MVKLVNTRRTIMDLAEALIQDVGFNGFSYARIAGELGVKNAAIHYHFPTKEALGIAVIQRYRERFRLWTNNARIKDLPPVERLDWFFSMYQQLEADKGKVCLLGSMEVELNAIPPALQDEVKALHWEMLSWLQVVLDEGRQAGVFTFRGDSVSKAAVIIASLQGALQMARALGRHTFEAVVAQFKLDLLA
jgi:TetR/AcrR family transcriptional regulator, transcriptional repressor for nem operon